MSGLGMINSYEEAIEFMMQQLPMFSHTGAAAVKKGLDNITRLCEFLGNPQNEFPTVHIAGSNGKGSTSHILAACLQTAGYKVGLYTSPHLVDLRERFRINGALVEKEFVVNFINRCQTIIQEVAPSYFELNVAMAFEAFKEEKVDIAIVETGLGGRLDSTNIIHPILSVITNISLEHTQILGDTLAAIAAEKAGIIKPNTPVVIGEQHEATVPVFFTKSIQENATLYFAEDFWELVVSNKAFFHTSYKAIALASKEIWTIDTDLTGSYQIHNIKTALTALDLLRERGWNINKQAIANGLKNVKKITGLRGRWELLEASPYLMIDVAHNAAGFQFIKNNIALFADYIQEKAPELHLIIGFANDKDYNSALKLMPENAHYYCTQAQIPRALPYSTLCAAAQEIGLHATAYSNIEKALHAARKNATDKALIIITGSFFVVGEALSLLEK